VDLFITVEDSLAVKAIENVFVDESKVEEIERRVCGEQFKIL
jgi:hypothetical protein